jgi:hypothetical protein
MDLANSIHECFVTLLCVQGTNASPLRKALNDSALGSAMLGGGMDDELKQPIFRWGWGWGCASVGVCAGAGAFVERNAE